MYLLTPRLWAAFASDLTLGDSVAGPKRGKRGQSATAKAKVAKSRAIARLHGRAEVAKAAWKD
jgi:hypothetical protein